MKKATFLLIILFVLGGQIFCQTNYSLGYSDGYKVGYCYNRGVNCVPPVVPVTPVSRVGESLDSYFDGYNRGLLVGANASINAINKQNIQKSNSAAVYGQPQYIPKIERFKPDYSFYENALKQNQQNYEQKVAVDNKQKEKNNQIEEIMNKYSAPEKNLKRKEYVNLLK